MSLFEEIDALEGLFEEMHIVELNEGDQERVELNGVDHESVESQGAVVASDTKRALVGAGARALFYPTLLYNVVRNKIQPEFRWWDKVDEFILLGAVPFPADVPRLKDLGVAGVVTLNESYETLVPTSLYHEHGINHLVIPTRDYLFAPTHNDISKAVDFIHGNASSRKVTYVHCKAGRGRSTTIVLCYLVTNRNMTPEAAYQYVRSIRPRVLLASAQWQAVQDYYYRIKNQNSDIQTDTSIESAPDFSSKGDPTAFDDGSVVLVTESDLDGYDETDVSGTEDMEMLVDLGPTCRVQSLLARQPVPGFTSMQTKRLQGRS